MSRATGLALILCAGLVIAAGIGGAWIAALCDRPGPSTEEKVLRVPKGVATSDIAQGLYDADVVVSPWLFHLAVLLENAQGRLQAGEYAFPAAISPRAAVRLITSGKVVIHRLTVPEGLTSAQVVALVADAEPLEGNVGEVPAEGTLLPETYHFTWGDSRAAVIARMSAAMQKTVDALWPKRAPDVPLSTAEEAVILASIVEKETGRADEQPRVAAVFLNRLRRGMPLQADPTVIYAVTRQGGSADGGLTKADLATPSPFNTYLVKGLPPSPIANPGRSAIAAVLKPANSDELYFVADGKGGHRFARTLAEHRRNVAEWRKLRGSAPSEGEVAP